MGTRFLFGTLGAGYLLLMFLIGDWFFNLSILLFALIGVKELYAAFRQKGYKPLSFTGYICILFLYLFHMYIDAKLDFEILAIGIILMISMLVLFKSLNPIDIAITIMGFIYPGAIFLFMILLKKLPAPHEHYLLVLVLFTTFSTDTFAYLVGRKFGKTKLSPYISPNKTIEGSIGGLVGSIVVSFILGYCLNSIYNLQIDYTHYGMIGLLSGVFSQLGDLTASKIKRFCAIKDFGMLLPGHGGLLDRFDSLLFTIPIIYGYYLLFLFP